MKKDYTRYRRRRKMKSIIGKIMLVLLITFLLCVINVIVNNTYKTKFEKLPDLDKQMFTKIGEVFKAFENSNTDIWTENYRLDKAPVLVSGQSKILPFLSRGVYVFNIDLSDKIYAKEIDVPDEIWAGSVYRIAGVYLKGMPLFIHKGFDDVNIAGNEAVAVKYNKKSFNNPDAPNSIDGTLILGGFDILVARNSEMPVYERLETYDYSREHLGLMGVESRIIDEMLKCRDNPEKLDNLIAEFIKVREERYKFNRVIGTEEPLCEMTLGCAQYSRYKLNGLIGSEYSFFEKNNGTEFEESFCEALTQDEKERKEYFERESLRQSGAAIGFVLDKLELGGGWRSAIENGTDENIVTPYSILKEYCIQKCESYKDLNIEEIKQKYSYEVYAGLVN